MAYSDKVIDHYENPRNVGSFAKGEENRKKWDSYQPIEVVKFITGGSYGLQ